jgi:hypothetical protein
MLSITPKVFTEIERCTYMIHHLMCQSPVVLQDVVVFCSNCSGDLLCSRKYLSELIVRNVR